MFKLLLVDDFFIERENVKKILGDSGLELEIIGECENGVEALEFLEHLEPDFILSDIEMPLMNGLDLGKMVREKYSHIKILLFSSHSKFEYAKRAIDIEAYAYVLKPVVKEELIKALQKLIDENSLDLVKRKEEHELLELVKSSKPLLFEKFKRELFFGWHNQSEEIIERMAYFDILYQSDAYVTFACEIDEYEKTFTEKTYEQQEILWASILKTFREATTNAAGILFARMEDRSIAFLLPIKLEEQTEAFEFIYGICDQITDALKSRDISISMGISEISYELNQIGDMFLQAQQALKYKFNAGKNQILNYEDTKNIQEVEHLELAELQKKIREVLLSGNEGMAHQFIRKTFEDIENHASKSSIRNLCFSMIMCVQITLSELTITFADIYGKEELLWEKLLKFETIYDVKMWLKNILLFAINYINEKKDRKGSQLAVEVKRYIENNFSEEISVNSIADALFYNPNYLNNYFKEEEGLTILDYLTQVRMNAAKALLTDHLHVKVQEIGLMVGYKNEAYFRTLFKRHFGLSPKVFRMTVTKNES